MTQTTLLMIGGAAILGVHVLSRTKWSFLKKGNSKMADIQEVSSLAQQFVSQPTMNPDKLKATATLLSTFLPEKVGGAIVPLASLLTPSEVSTLIGLVLKIVEVFFPNIGPFLPKSEPVQDPAPITISAPDAPKPAA